MGTDFILGVFEMALTDYKNREKIFKLIESHRLAKLSSKNVKGGLVDLGKVERNLKKLGPCFLFKFI